MPDDQRIIQSPLFQQAVKALKALKSHVDQDLVMYHMHDGHDTQTCGLCLAQAIIAKSE